MCLSSILACIDVLYQRELFGLSLSELFPTLYQDVANLTLSIAIERLDDGDIVSELDLHRESATERPELQIRVRKRRGLRLLWRRLWLVEQFHVIASHWLLSFCPSSFAASSVQWPAC